MKSPVNLIKENSREAAEIEDLDLTDEEVVEDPDEDEEDRMGMEKDRFWESREEAISSR